jgi:phosphatidylglycerol---prolipoprotein diacylglyceryl transferase
MELEFGGITLHGYGLMIGVAVVVGVMVAERVYIKEKGDKKIFDRALWWTLGGGVVGARLYHVIDYWEYYSAQIDEVVKVWQGGLGIYGALAGGILGLFLALRGKARGKKEVYRLLDAGAFGLLPAQAIGRVGNWINQELYGLPTDLPWGIYISPEYRAAGFEEFSYFHPLFAYEALLLVVGFGVLWWLWQHKRWAFGRGMYFGVYLIWYGVVRGGLEFLRIDPWRVGGIPVALWVSIVVIGLGAGLLRYKERE